MGEFTMPSLGADMVEGTLLEWLVKPGQPVHRGDIVAVVDTDKAAIEVESFEDGVVEELLVGPGTRVPVGTALARFGTGAPAVASPLVRHLAHTAGVDLATVAGTGPDGTVTRSDVEAARRVRASPLARRRAGHLGIDLGSIAGTGPDGAVTAADVERAAVAVPAPRSSEPTPLPEVTEQPEQPEPQAEATAPPGDRTAAMRHAIGELMARSKREIPHYYVSTTIDLSAALAWMRDVNAQRPVDRRLVPAALLLKAAARAARAVPGLNGHWVDGHLADADHVHLGVAVSLRPSGLVAPAILDADTLDLDTLMQRLLDIVTRARTGRLRRPEMTEGTLTVTNLGDNGAESVFGVIFPPQVALVGLGRIVERPWASGGLLGVRPTVTATLSADHRATDGHHGSRYLSKLDELLQSPAEL